MHVAQMFALHVFKKLSQECCTSNWQSKMLALAKPIATKPVLRATAIILQMTISTISAATLVCVEISSAYELSTA